MRHPHGGVIRSADPNAVPGLAGGRIIGMALSGKLRLQARRWKSVKDQLKKETNHKCAYCEAPTSLVAYGDVEHYRPKSEYWWLAYCYENYLVSCRLCNQKFKKAKFPVSGTPLPRPRITKASTDAYIEAQLGRWVPDPLKPEEVEAFEQLHRAEAPSLLNPYLDSPHDYFSWAPVDAKRVVILVPARRSAARVVRAAIDDYGLNRQEPAEARYHHYRLYRVFRLILGDGRIHSETRTEAERALEMMRQDQAPFAGMVRYFDGLSATPL